MTYALIGCGRIAKNHVTAAVANKLDIAALCDLEPEKAERYAAENHLSAMICTDYRKMLREVRPKFVAIATESGKHAAIALDCIDASVNVLIEKPMALSIADADAIIARAAQRGVRVGVCHQNRYNRSVSQLRKAVEAGAFGRIYHAAATIRWNRSEDYYRQAKWRGTWEQDGGCLMNQCIHNIDMLQWMLGGNIESVYAQTANFAHPYIEAEDIGLAVVKFKSGALATIEGTVNVFPRNLEETLTIFGELGTVKLGGASLNRIEHWNFAGSSTPADDTDEMPPDVYGFGHTPLYAEFMDAIVSGRKPYIAAEDGKRAMELVLAMYKSAHTGEAVRLPLEECATLDFMQR